MTDTDQQLAVLTDQRVDIVLAGHHYSARRPTLNDFAAMNRYRAQQAKDGVDETTLNIEWTLFILARLIVSEQLTPEQIGDRIPLEALGDLPAVLDALGFK